MQRSKVCVLEERDLFELECLQEFAWTVNFRHSWRKFFVYIFAFNHTCLEPSLYVSLTYQKHWVSPSSTPHLVFLGQGLPVHLEFFGWLDWLVTKAQGLHWAGLWVPHLSFHLHPGDANSSTYAHATSTLPTEIFPRPTWRLKKMFMCVLLVCLCTMCMSDGSRGWRRASDPLGPEFNRQLGAAMRILGIDLLEELPVLSIAKLFLSNPAFKMFNASA